METIDKFFILINLISALANIFAGLSWPKRDWNVWVSFGIATLNIIVISIIVYGD